MRIGLQTWGSDGDMRPFIALAGGLEARGHQVTLVATSVDLKDYRSYGEALGIDFIPVHRTYESWGHDGLSAIAQNMMRLPALQQITNMYEAMLEPAADEMYEAAERLCAENDVVIGHFLHYPMHLAAERAGRPRVSVIMTPDIVPSRHRTPTRIPYLGEWMNPWWWKFAGAMTNRLLLRYINQFRSRKGAPPAADVVNGTWLSKTLTLIPASPALYERPADWIDQIQLSGFLGMSAETERSVTPVPEDLQRFIAAGDPPIYMTFGTVTPFSSPAELFLEAVRLAGCRAIMFLPPEQQPLAAGNPNVFCAGTVPYQDVFPQCSLVVHHGGAGTTHSAVLAGRPSVVVEHYGDQIFWGTQLKRMGVGKLLHKKSVTPKKLAREIRNVLASPAMKDRALQVSESMKKEDGRNRAVELIEKHLAIGC